MEGYFNGCRGPRSSHKHDELVPAKVPDHGDKHGGGFGDVSVDGGSVDQRSVLYLYAISNPGNSEKVKAAIKEELDKLLKDGVTEEELAAAKKGYLQAQSVGRASDGNVANILSKTAEVGRTMSYYSDYEQQLGTLTREQVLAALKTYVDPKRIVIVTAGDFEKAEEK